MLQSATPITSSPLPLQVPQRHRHTDGPLAIAIQLHSFSH